MRRRQRADALVVATRAGQHRRCSCHCTPPLCATWWSVARRPAGTDELLDAVLAHRAAVEPSVATPLLAAPAAEGIDSSLRFFTASEEEEKLKREEQEELNSLWAVPVERRTHQQMQHHLPPPEQGGQEEKEEEEEEEAP